MPITGLEGTLKNDLSAAIRAGIVAECAVLSVLTPNCIDGLAKGIADALIPFLVSNIQVQPGIAVTTTGGPTAQVGATVAPGQIT